MARKKRPRTEAEIAKGMEEQAERKAEREDKKREEADEIERHRATVAKNGIEYYKSKEAIASLGKAQCASIVAGLENELAS